MNFRGQRQLVVVVELEGSDQAPVTLVARSLCIEHALCRGNWTAATSTPLKIRAPEHAKGPYETIVEQISARRTSRQQNLKVDRMGSSR